MDETSSKDDPPAAASPLDLLAEGRPMPPCGSAAAHVHLELLLPRSGSPERLWNGTVVTSTGTAAYTQEKLADVIHRASLHLGLHSGVGSVRPVWSSAHVAAQRSWRRAQARKPGPERERQRGDAYVFLASVAGDMTVRGCSQAEIELLLPELPAAVEWAQRAGTFLGQCSEGCP